MGSQKSHNYLVTEHTRSSSPTWSGKINLPTFIKSVFQNVYDLILLDSEQIFLVHLKLQFSSWMFSGHIAQRKELGFAVCPLQSTYSHWSLVGLGYTGELFNCDFCWLGGESPKKLSWPLRNVWWESASRSRHRRCLEAAWGAPWLFIVALHCFWMWPWSLRCPKAYCDAVPSAMFMISCFSETEEVCLCCIFTPTLCCLFPF